MTNHERNCLTTEYKNYIEDEFNKISGFIFLVVGFCLATLSANRIPPEVNLGLVIIVFIIFLSLLIFAKKSDDSELRLEINRLKKKYKKHDNSEDILSELDTYDIWVGFDKRSMKSFMPILIAILFCGYTAFEHLAEMLNWCL